MCSISCKSTNFGSDQTMKASPCVSNTYCRKPKHCRAVEPVRIRTSVFFILLCGYSSTTVAQSVESTVTELDEIVVEEEGEPESRLPLGVGFSGNTLSTAPGAGGDPVRALQSLPGLIYTDDEESLPAVRGSRPDDNYFEADFSTVSYLFHIDGLISVFNTDLIKSFEVYQSGYGPEYSGVTGGVFDVTLRDPKTDRVRTSIDVSLLQSGALVEGPISEKQSFYLAGRISYWDLILGDIIEADDGVEIVQFPKYSDYQGKYVYKDSEDNRLTFQFNGANDIAQIDIAEGSIEVDNDPDAAGTSRLDVKFHEQALVWDYKANDRLSVKSLLSRSYTDESGEFGGAGEYQVVDENYVLKSHASYSLNDSHDISVGGQFKRSTVDVDAALSIPVCGELDPDCFITGSELIITKLTLNLNDISAFLKDSWYVTDRLTLYPGVAFQDDDYLNKQFVEPRFAAEYALSDETVLTAALGQYHQAPDIVESNTDLGNPELDFSSAIHAQIGVQRFLNDGWEIKSEVYYKLLDNLVTSDPDTRYSNNGKGYTYGLDTLIRKNITNKFSGWASVSLATSRREDKETGESFVFNYDQPVNVSLVGNYKFNKKWSIGAKLWAHSGTPYTPVIGAIGDAQRPGFFRPIYGKLNSDRFATYHRIDLRVDRTFSRKKDNTMGAYFELFNILGTKNELEYNYNADYTERTIENQITADFSFGFKATF